MTTTAKAPAKPRKSDQARSLGNAWERKARSWLNLKTDVSQSATQQSTWRDDLKTLVLRRGRRDADGHRILRFTQPIAYEGWSEKEERRVPKTAFGLKAQRSLKPKVPLPLADKAEELLRAKGLWLSKKDEAVIADINRTNRYVRVVIEVNPDALAEAELQKLVTEDEYDACLEDQVEDFSLVILDS